MRKPAASTADDVGHVVADAAAGEIALQQYLVGKGG
jgi:hypothetical protein